MSSTRSTASKIQLPRSVEEADKNLEAMRTTSKVAWKARATHANVVLPSGAIVSIKIPDMSALIEAGEIPNELVDLVSAAAESGSTPQPDDIARLREVQEKVIAATVTDPKLTIEDVRDIPEEDKGFLQEIAFRQRDVDMIGRSIAGLEAIEKYATFRKEQPRTEDLLDL